MSVAPIKDATRAFDDTRNSSGCDDTDEEWTRIRFYILDEGVETAYACVGEGVGEYCGKYGL